jgi:hypothetical protein
VRIVFVTSKAPLSCAIRYAFSEDCSHVAFVFDEQWVVHSTILGLHPEWLNTFLKKHTIVHEIKYDFPLEVEEQIYRSILDRSDGDLYDYWAFAYFIWCGFLYKFFNRPLPKKNPWGKPWAFLCVGVYNLLPEWFKGKNKPEDAEMITPYGLYQLLLTAKGDLVLPQE